MLWINFLHLYQPANASQYHIDEATDKAYRRIIRALAKNPRIKMTMNISGCLLARWQHLGYKDLLSQIRRLINREQIELVGTAAYHPILPLMPNQEIISQIKEHESLVRETLGQKITMKGFFLPEMAYSNKIAKTIKSLGYEWLILDSFSLTGNEKDEADTPGKIVENSAGLKIFFRSREDSHTYPPDMIAKLLTGKNDHIRLFTATDGEIYGLRHEDPTGEFEKILKNKDLKTITISTHISRQKEIPRRRIIASNWESTKKEIDAGMPFALWFNNTNEIQTKIWKLADMAISANHRRKKDKNHYWSRWHLVRGLASCTFWWASGKDFRRVFGPIAWNPDEIEKGLNELIRAIRSLATLAPKEKIKAEKLLADIRLMIWKKHWQKYGK